jgi:hypothetical protein
LQFRQHPPQVLKMFFYFCPLKLTHLINLTTLKKIFLFRFIIFLVFALCCRFQPYAQISAGGNPPSFDHNIDRHSIPVISVSAPDVNRLLDEDAFYEKQGMAMRFAESVPVDIRLTETGHWESLPDGGRICRLTIESENAQALIIYYSRFRIPDGGKLFLYNREQSQVIGAFTSKNNPKGQGFATEMTYGGQVTLEYYEPEYLSPRPDIVISEVGYVYRTADRFYGSRGFGNADTCEVNVNCPEGNLLQDQKNGVARIIVKSGFSSLWCTGSLINNTRLDFTPYFLTADHCGANASPENYNQWIFYFRYEGPDCEDPVNDSLFNTYTMVGASKLAASGGAGLASDFKLLLLNESVPGSYNPFFNGWNLADTPSAAGVTIHHPEGDIKKISTYADTLISTNWGSIPNTHWKVYWVQTETNWGVTEGGSSGSPLFDEHGRILGQLTGGEASCRFLTKPDYYGKISYSWAANASGDSTMLRPWLDPDSTGVLQLDGVVSVPEINNTFSPLHIYPNPTNGVVYIADGRLKNKRTSVYMYDLPGALVLQMENIPLLSGETIMFDMSHFPQGIYFIKVIAGGEIFSGKVVR